jgi:hypothetical protein
VPIAIECEGAIALLDLLEQAAHGPVPKGTVQNCLLRNRYLVDFYCQWEGINGDSLTRALTHLTSTPEAYPVVGKLQIGFRQAATRVDELRRRMATLRTVDFDGMEARLRKHLPADTPVDCTIHLTVDAFNGAFQFKDGIGLSLTLPCSDPVVLSDLICHELHHVGFGYGATRDSRRQAVLKEKTPRAVVVEHVENLIREGMAVYFFTSAQFTGLWSLTPQERMATYRAKIDSFRAHEKALFLQAEGVLLEAFQPSPDFEACRRAAKAPAVDLDGIQPPGHYLGWRMIQTIAIRDTVDRITANIVDISGFLEQYNVAADQAGSYVFGPETIRGYADIWQ